MITTKELLHKFKAFIERNEFETENPAFRMEYASKSLGLEIGYYSLSKTDLFVGGTKRGSLIKRPRKDFNGYAYCFLGDRLQIAKRIVNGEDRNITFLEYEDNYCFGYDFDYLGELIPHRCFAYEIDGDRITGFKIMQYFHDIEGMKEHIIHEEKYLYTGGELSAICEKKTYFDFISEEERPFSEDVYDYFTGRYWVPARCVAKDTDRSDNESEDVFDDQKKLCKKLEKKIKQDMSLDQAIQAFFDVVAEAKPNDEEMLLYEVGSYAVSDKETCVFSLVRQTPSPDDEFYQLILELHYDICNEVRSLSECEWHEKGDDDLQDYVKKSEAYNVLKDKTIKKIRVWVDET